MGGGGRSRHLGNDFGVLAECESEFGKLNCLLNWLYVGGGDRWMERLDCVLSGLLSRLRVVEMTWGFGRMDS